MAASWNSRDNSCMCVGWRDKGLSDSRGGMEIRGARGAVVWDINVALGFHGTVEVLLEKKYNHLEFVNKRLGVVVALERVTSE